MSDPRKHTHPDDGTVPGLHGELIPTPVLGCPACATVHTIGDELGAVPEGPAPSLTDFLLARFAEDEAVARTCANVYPAPWDLSDRGWVAYVKADAPHFREVARLEQEHLAREDQPGWLGDALAHIARHDPARVLAECDAKRRIVELFTWTNPLIESDTRHVRSDDSDSFEEALCLLALPYADHPDYREEWHV